METQTAVASKATVKESIHITGAEAVIKCLIAEGVDILIWIPWRSYYAGLRRTYTNIKIPDYITS